MNYYRLGAILFAVSVVSLQINESWAQSDYKNVVEISAQGLGLSGTSESNTLKANGQSSDYSVTQTLLKLNYGRQLSNRWWLRGGVSVDTNKTEYKSDLFDDSERTTVGLTVLGQYNFSDEITNSGFLDFGLGLANNEIKSGNLKNEISFNGLIFGGGKRWSLDGIGIPNGAYKLSAYIFSGSGDISGVGSTKVDLEIVGVTINFIQFDLFF